MKFWRKLISTSVEVKNNKNFKINANRKLVATIFMYAPRFINEFITPLKYVGLVYKSSFPKELMITSVDNSVKFVDSKNNIDNSPKNEKIVRYCFRNFFIDESWIL